jgi:hypothetical protein
MKHFLTLLLSNFLLVVALSQPTISPSQSNEYCPLTEYTFNVTITKSYQSMIGVGGCFVTQLPQSPVGSTFTFKGKFGDANQKQSFRIYHPDNTWTDFDFKKIKSLFYGTSCTPIQPNVGQISAPRCQIVNTPISFSNVQWSTAFESPALCFGSITTYEYLLPTGWSIGANVSNGSNWIPGGNSVTVTSDLANGVNGSVYIRPVNNCGAGLTNGQSQVVQIPINRPAPTLTITGTQDYICNTGQTASFTMNGMPAGSTIVWQLSDATNATIVGCNTCSTVTVQKATNFTGFVNLTATVSHCTFTYPVGPKQIALGTGRTTVFFTQLTATCEIPSRAYFYGAVEGFTSATNYDWYAKDMTNASNPFVLKQSGLGPTADFPLGSKGNRYYTIRVIATTPCGTVSTIDAEGLIWAPSCSGGGARIAISPNPAQNNLNISLLTDKELTSEKVEKLNIYTIEIQDKNGNLIMSNKQQGNAKQASINISTLRPDYYILRVWTGTEWISNKLFKQ